jgi:hypothetical protein
LLPISNSFVSKMIDPFSLVTGIAGLVSLALEIMADFVSMTKNAPKDISNLSNELEALSTVLRNLAMFLSSESIKGDLFDDTSVLCASMASCKRQLEELREKLNISKIAVMKVAERLKWLYRKEEVEQATVALRRCSQTFQFSLTIDGCRLLSKSSDDVANILQAQKRMLEGLKGIDAGIAATYQRIYDITMLLPDLKHVSLNIIELENCARRWSINGQDEKTRKIIDWISPIKFWQKQKDTIDSRQAGTGNWILHTRQFQDWKAGSVKTLWCPGLPGAGKTVLSSVVIKDLQDTRQSQEMRVGLAFIYCNYKEQTIQRAPNLFASLLQQLLLPTAQTSPRD